MVELELTKIKSTNNWREVANAARTTISMDSGEGEPSSDWKYKMLYAEHSPIRLLRIKWEWKNLKTWISTHFVRHHVGYTPFVESQRSDKNHNNIYNRDKRPQGALIKQYNDANAQALINMSAKRLCNQSHSETTQALKIMLKELKDIEPELYNACVPQCVRLGFCPEFKSCGYINRAKGKKERKKYIERIKKIRGC